MALSKKEVDKAIKSLSREFNKIAMFGYEKAGRGRYKLVVDSAPETKKKEIAEHAEKVVGRALQKDEIVYNNNGPIYF